MQQSTEIIWPEASIKKRVLSFIFASLESKRKCLPKINHGKYTCHKLSQKCPQTKYNRKKGMKKKSL